MVSHGLRIFAFTGVVLCVAGYGVAADQFGRSRFELAGSAGYAVFPDEGPLHHFTAGASTRIYLARWFALEPEVTLMVRGSTDRDLVFIPSLVWDIRGRTGRFRPYVIGGIGTLTHWESTPWWTYRNTSATTQIGGGVQIFLSRRLSIAPEARIGWTPVFRIGARIGWTFD